MDAGKRCTFDSAPQDFTKLRVQSIHHISLMFVNSGSVHRWMCLRWLMG